MGLGKGFVRLCEAVLVLLGVVLAGFPTQLHQVSPFSALDVCVKMLRQEAAGRVGYLENDSRTCKPRVGNHHRPSSARAKHHHAGLCAREPTCSPVSTSRRLQILKDM